MTNTSVTVVMKDEKNFLADPIDLKKLMKDLNKSSKTAIDVLLSLMASDVDPKIKLTAATKLLELQVAVAKEINTDQLQRLIADVKHGAASKSSISLKDDPNRPLVDFTTIRSVE